MASRLPFECAHLGAISVMGDGPSDERIEGRPLDAIE
jgi:hypothetical protein